MLQQHQPEGCDGCQEAAPHPVFQLQLGCSVMLRVDSQQQASPACTKKGRQCCKMRSLQACELLPCQTHLCSRRMSCPLLCSATVVLVLVMSPSCCSSVTRPGAACASQVNRSVTDQCTEGRGQECAASAPVHCAPAMLSPPGLRLRCWVQLPAWAAALRP